VVFIYFFHGAKPVRELSTLFYCPPNSTNRTGSRLIEASSQLLEKSQSTYTFPLLSCSTVSSVTSAALPCFVPASSDGEGGGQRTQYPSCDTTAVLNAYACSAKNSPGRFVFGFKDPLWNGSKLSSRTIVVARPANQEEKLLEKKQAKERKTDHRMTNRLRIQVAGMKPLHLNSIIFVNFASSPCSSVSPPGTW